MSKRLDVLEAAAASLGGCDLAALRTTDHEKRVLSVADARVFGDLVRIALLAIPVHPALVLASLSQPPQHRLDRRRSGAYYTDFRLATFLAGRYPRPLEPDDLTIDPASGTGMLLIACALRFLGDQESIDGFIRDAVCAADLSSAALRGVKLALASLTSNNAAIESLARRLRRLDSLTAGPSAWEDVAPHGFKVVIGNPPWEKLKISRHEYLAANGDARHYGADYSSDSLDGLGDARLRMAEYVRDLGEIYEGGGESDLYRLFLALALRLARSDGGQVAMLVPAGLIRALGTEAIRRDLFERATKLQIAVLENRARFFGIDTRFKFLALHGLFEGEAARSALVMDHADADAERVSITSSVTIGRSKLQRMRPDLTVPEVRGAGEWDVYQRMNEAGAQLGRLSQEWPLDIVRELDMTNDRRVLKRQPDEGEIPLVEGRMVHQFWCGHKAYISGEGRAARWRVTEPGERALTSQFWVDPEMLSSRQRERAMTSRIGFCDITGQTNERTMLAARIPIGAICGNKVPTITFAAHSSPADAGDLWLAVVNSFPFDWLLRRLATTTVNYFVLRSVPFPSISVADAAGRRLIELTRAIADVRDSALFDAEEYALWRAEIDALVFRAYGLSEPDARLILDDFPLLDRGQPSIRGERCSTITRDLVVDALTSLDNEEQPETRLRLEEARSVGARAYTPPQIAKAGDRTLATVMV
jgi:hypothetical protein